MSSALVAIHPNLHLIQHPVLEDMLTEMRKETTSDERFSYLLDHVGPFLAYEALHDLPLKQVQINTPVTTMQARELAEKKVYFVPVLGAGQAFLNGMWKGFLPWASAGMIAARRDEETAIATVSYDRLPKSLKGYTTVVTDPMLATGGSSSDALSLLKERTEADHIILICLVAAPEGVRQLLKDHPDVRIYSLALDENLNEKKFIVPGLGDAGDRYFGNKPT